MNWAHFLLQANIYLVVFYAFYKLLLDKETYFVLNRIYLMAAGILSFGLPFIKVDWFSTQAVTQPVYDNMGQLNQLINAATTVAPEVNSLPIGQVLALIYFSGVFLLTLRFIYQLVKVSKLLKVNPSGTAFSFFKTTRMDADLHEADTIRHHEEVHGRQYHSMDVLLIEVLGIISWFNPIIYLYKQSVKSIHEFLADEQAAKYIGNKETYALLLVSNALGVPVNSLTNSFFNQPLLKKRIFMLHQPKSSRTALLKYGLFAPLLGLGLMLSSATVRENEELKSLSTQIPIEQPLALVTGLNPMQDDWKDFYAYLNRTIGMPKAGDGKVLNGSTSIRFVLKGGNIENIGIAGKPLGAGADAMVMQQILAYKRFQTAKDGNYILTVAFKDSENSSSKVEQVSVDGYTKLDVVTIIAANRIYDFISIDKQPTFPGGMSEFYNYLKKSVKFPAEAKAKNINGKVFLSFVVETDGSIEHVQVERKLGYGTDEEAVRVLEASPKWLPGIIDGRAVRVKYNIPINFNTVSTAKKDTTKVEVQKELTFKSKTGMEPLYYIDGVVATTNVLAGLDPNKIESIVVLKGESAKRFNKAKDNDGAILITTKKAISIKVDTQEEAKP